MNPRLASSKKWTEFPNDYIEQIRSVFQENYTEQLKNSTIHVEGRIYPEEVVIRVGIHEKGRLAQMNFEISAQYSPKDIDAVDKIHDAIDFIASAMDEYFEEPEEADFPTTWTKVDFEKRDLYFQVSTVNTELEAMADKLLGDEAKDLVTDESDSQDVLDNSDIVGAEEAVELAKKKQLH